MVRRIPVQESVCDHREPARRVLRCLCGPLLLSNDAVQGLTLIHIDVIPVVIACLQHKCGEPWVVADEGGFHQVLWQWRFLLVRVQQSLLWINWASSSFSPTETVLLTFWFVNSLGRTVFENRRTVYPHTNASIGVGVYLKHVRRIQTAARGSN